jgi:glycine/D-amino acid oxidase-like deaminating enzyme
MSETSDVIIIGAGIMGCSSAFELARRGVNVTVLERDTVGAGGTGRSSAIIRQHYSNELTARMALHSLRVFQNFGDEVGGECGFEHTGWVALASEHDKSGLESNIAFQQELGIDTRLISVAELAEMIPGVASADVAAVAHEHESGYADPHLTVNAYADAARRHGAKIKVNRGVTGFRFAKDRVAGVEVSGETFEAPIVINCAGPWGGKVASMAGLEVPIDSCRVQVAVFRRPPAFAAHPVVMDFIQGVYLRSETGNLTLVGSIDPAEANALVDPDDYPEHGDTKFVVEMAEMFMNRCPSMADSESTTAYASLYAVTPDWHPIVDEMPAGSGFFICSGFSGHGYKLGPAVGEMVADLVTGVTEPRFPAHLFRASRFDEGDLVRGRYEYSIAG